MEERRVLKEVEQMAKKKKKKENAVASFEPRRDTGRFRPVTARVAIGDVNDKYSEYPSNGLTPRRLARIFRQADEGDVRAQMELFEEIEEKDPHLFSQMQTRKLAVTGLDWEVQPFSEEPLDKEVAEFVDEQLKRIESFDAVLIDMLDAIGKGISILEIAWGVENGQNVIDDIEYVHPKKLLWDSQTDEMLVCTKEYPSGIPLPENKFVVHRYKAKSGHASRAGLLRVVAWMYLFKNYDIKDWVSFCEVFGMPLRLGKYDASASEDDKRQLMEAILSLGTDAAGIVPSSTMIEFIESNKTTSVEIYEKLARYCDEQVSKAILGQTLTSDSGGGSYAQSKTHDEVRHDLTEADCKALAVTIRRDRPLVEFNFGPEVDLPFFTFDCKEAEDQKDTVEVYRTLVCDMGLEIPKSHIYQKFNIPKPETGEEILRPPVFAAAQESLTVPEEGVEQLKLKDGDAEQRIVDGIAGEAAEKSKALFAAMLGPILDRINKSESLEELQETLKDRASLEKLYEEMESPELEDLLQQGLYLSSLVGRTVG